MKLDGREMGGKHGGTAGRLRTTAGREGAATR